MKTIPASADLVSKYCPGKFSTIARATVKGDKVFAVYGIYLQETCQVIFAWISDEIKNNPRFILKSAMEFMKFVKSRGLPTFAVLDYSIPKADLFLLHFGFRPFQGNLWLYGE